MKPSRLFFFSLLINCLSLSALNPSSLDALNNLSVAYGMAQDYNKSIEVLMKVTAQYPTNQLAWKNLATIYEHIGEKEKAQECRDKMNALQGQ